jgi:uncharacterized protein with GYD domain
MACALIRQWIGIWQMIEAAYTAEAWKLMLKKPEDRGEAIRPVIEKLGGSMVNSWFAFGDHDIVLLAEFPDNVSAASFAVAAMAGGGLRSIKTTPLLELPEGREVMKRAAKSGYRPPGK